MTLVPHKFAGLAGFALLLASAAHAQSEDAPAKSLPLWELGAFAFGVSQQAYPGSDEQLTRGLLLPYGQYRGRFFRADRETAGLRAVKTPVYELDVGVSASFGGSSSEIGVRRGMPALGTLAEFGPRLKINLGSGSTGADADRSASRWRVELPLRPRQEQRRPHGQARQSRRRWWERG